MEAPTKKEIVEKMEWGPVNAESVGSGQYLQGTYEWEGKKWTPTLQVIGDAQAFEWALKQRSGRNPQCRTLAETVCNCASEILLQIEDHVRKHEAEQEQQRKLDAYNRKIQEWADKANSVSLED